MERYQQQLKKGALELVVLALVAEAPTYGYQLITELGRRSGGLFTLKEGTLYPVLYRLEDDGLIAASWQAGQGRNAPKKYYSITEAGGRKLAQLTGLWQQFAACVDTLLNGGSAPQTKPNTKKPGKEESA